MIFQWAKYTAFWPRAKGVALPPGSAQRFGWTARALVRAYQATGNLRYMDAVRRMMESLRVHRIADGPSPALVAQDPVPDKFSDGPWESPAMVAVAASAIALPR